VTLSAEERFQIAKLRLLAERRAALARGEEPRLTVDAWARYGSSLPQPDDVEHLGNKDVRRAYRNAKASGRIVEDRTYWTRGASRLQSFLFGRGSTRRKGPA